MKFHILVMNNLYSVSEHFQKCSVCQWALILFLAYIQRKTICIDSQNVNNNCCVVITSVEPSL